MLCCVSMREQLLTTPVPNSTVDSHTPGAIRPGRVPTKESTVLRLDSALVQTESVKLSTSPSICSAVKQGHVTIPAGVGIKDGVVGVGGLGGLGGGLSSSQLLMANMLLESNRSLHTTASSSVSGSSSAPTCSSPYWESMRMHVLTISVPYSTVASHTKGMIPERRPVRLRVVIRDDWTFAQADSSSASVSISISAREKQGHVGLVTGEGGKREDGGEGEPDDGEEGIGAAVFSLQLFWKNMSLARRISLHAATWASDSGITFASSCRRMLCCVSMREQLLTTPVPNSTVDSHTPGARRPGRVPARERTVVRVDSILVQTDNSKLSDSMSICSAVKQGHVTASGVGDGQRGGVGELGERGEGGDRSEGAGSGVNEKDGDGGDGRRAIDGVAAIAWGVGEGGREEGDGGVSPLQLLTANISLESNRFLHAAASSSVSGSSSALTPSTPFSGSI